jgi:hypothetical protein
MPHAASSSRPHSNALVLALLAALVPVLVFGGEEEKKPAAPDPAAKPKTVLGLLAALRRNAGPLEAALDAELQRGNLGSAEKLCRRLIEVAPYSPNGYYNLACILALRGEKDGALEQLDAAVAHGFNNPAHIQTDSDLTGLHDDPRFAQIVEKAQKAPPLAAEQPPEPFVIVDREAWVQEENVAFDPQTRRLATFFRFAIPDAEKREITTLKGAAGDLLRQWQKEGTAAGNVGDLYDNLDGDHSDMARDQFPQLTWIEYGPAAKQLQLHWGLQDKMVHPGVVIGNASVAQTAGPYWRSMPRMACASPQGAALLYQQYSTNKMYFYPCHVDHSPGRDGKLGEKKGAHGDVYPANTPYLITSQGSSGTDQAFLRAVACTLAAFKPEVKQFLAERNAVMPTVQMIFRMSNKAVKAEADYLTGAAHPPVFNGGQIDLEKMLRTAHELTREAVPPLVRIKVQEESRVVNGREHFDPPGVGEAHFDTPCSVARIWRGTPYRRRMLVSAEGSEDLNRRPLTWRWVLLQGDPAKVTLQPLDPAGSQAEVTVCYQPRHPVSAGAALESNRVDIGVFAHNGACYSAPAFITFFTLDNEAREYDADGKILSVTYAGATEEGHYVDPVIALPKSWRDEYRYNERGQMTGWTRRRGEKSEEFTPDGRLIVKRAAEGQPAETRAVRYTTRARGPGQAPAIEETVEEK